LLPMKIQIISVGVFGKVNFAPKAHALLLWATRFALRFMSSRILDPFCWAHESQCESYGPQCEGICP
jgi:hypothetical protein